MAVFNDYSFIPSAEDASVSTQKAEVSVKNGLYKEYLAHDFLHADLPEADNQRYFDHGVVYLNDNSNIMRIRFVANALETAELFIANEGGKAFFETLQHADGRQAERYEIGGSCVDILMDEYGNIYDDFKVTPIFCPNDDQSINDENTWELGKTVELGTDLSLKKNLDMIRVRAMQRAKKCACFCRGENPPAWATKPYHIRELTNVQILGFSPKLVEAGGRVGHVDPNAPAHIMTLEEKEMIHEIGPGSRETTFIR